MIPGEDALDGAEGGYGSVAFDEELFSDGLGPVESLVVVEMEPEQDDDLLDFFSREEDGWFRHDGPFSGPHPSRVLTLRTISGETERV